MEAIDCIVSDWSYGECDKLCGGGTMIGTRTVIENAQFGGNCDDILIDNFDCNTGTCCADGDIKTFNWDTLMENGIDIPQYEITTFDIDENDLSLNIVVELDYLGYVTADDRRVGEFGVTYVLDFEDFNAHKDKIDEPGTCQNRQNNVYNGASWNEYWLYSDQPQNPGHIGEPGNYLAYPPPMPIDGEWQVSMAGDGCDKIVYSGKFTWTDLRNCKGYGGLGDSYTNIINDDNWVNLTGTFYINAVLSPFSHTSLHEL